MSCAGATLRPSGRPLWLLPIAPVVLLPQFANCTHLICSPLKFRHEMIPTLAANMLIRALVRRLNCCGGTWAGCSGCLRKLFTAMPVQDLHYHTSSKLAPAWHNVARAHVTLLHKAYHQNLTHMRLPAGSVAPARSRRSWARFSRLALLAFAFLLPRGMLSSPPTKHEVHP